MSTTGRRLLGGAAWIYGSQIASILIQFIYAAITTRVINEVGFGVYSIALSASALATLLSTGGIGQAVGRMESLIGGVISALWWFGVILGAICAFGLWLMAPFWAWIWSSPDSVDPIRLVALSTVVAPVIGVVGSLLRRQSRYRYISISTFCCNLVGMALGAWAVYMFRTPSSLVVSMITAQWLMCLVMSAGCVKMFVSRPDFKSALGHLGYGGRLTLVRLYTYCNGIIGPWAVASYVGAGALGQWNRADVVSTVPLQQGQTVIAQVLYPEFRHDRRSKARSWHMWPDLFALVSWVSLVVSLSCALVVPHMVPLLFGDGWQEAAKLIPYLSFIGGLSIVAAVISSAVESLGKLQWVWASQFIHTILLIPGVLLTALWNDVRLILVSLGCCLIAKIAYYIKMLVLNDIVDATRWKSRLVTLAWGACVLAVMGQLVLALVKKSSEGSDWAGVVLVLVLLLSAGLSFLTWRSWDPIKIAVLYGLFRSAQ